MSNIHRTLVLLDKHSKYVDIVDYFWWYETLETLNEKERKNIILIDCVSMCYTDVMKYKCSKRHLRKVLKKYYKYTETKEMCNNE